MEDAADCPYLYYEDLCHVRAANYDGGIHSIWIRRQNMTVPRRFTDMAAVLECQGLLRRIALGRGELLFIPNSLHVHDFVLERIRQDPFYLVDSAYRRRTELKCLNTSSG